MKRVYVYALPVMMIGAMGLSSCSDVDDDGISTDYAPKKLESEYFDFSTTKEVKFNLNYSAVAANSLVSVYLDESAGDEDGDEAAFRVFTDASGCYQGKASLPAYADSVWIKVEAFGVPAVSVARVVNGEVGVDITDASSSSASRQRATRAADGELDCHQVDASKKLYTIVKYDNWDGTYSKYSHGKIDYTWNASIFSDGKVNPNVLTEIKKTLWGNNATKPNGLDNSSLTRDTKHVNTTIAKAYQDADGTVKTVENAQVYLTFVHERAHYRNVLGYYYYKTGEAPASPDNVEKYIILPNASFAYDHPYANTTHSMNMEYYAYAPLQSYAANGAKNLRTQLLFKNPETGKMQKEFPAGYTIGYFVIADGFWIKDAYSRDYCHINTSCPFYYSNNEWNAGQTKRFISVTMKSDGTVVYGLEDGNDDKSYDDVMFTIDADPNFAIQDPERPVVEPEKGEIYATETTYKSYAFEDIWPKGGDYDLNDVIISHKRAVTFGSNSNNITEIVDEFTPIQPAGSATYTNAFAVVYSTACTSIECPGMTIEPETNSVIVSKNTNADKGKTFVVTRKFSGLSKKNFSEDINPYVIPQYKAGAEKRAEVHLPKHKGTSKIDASLSLTGKDAWYVDADGKFPFAISLPVHHYVPANEGVRIDGFYKRFASWITSGGEKEADWYLDYSE